MDPIRLARPEKAERRSQVRRPLALQQESDEALMGGISRGDEEALDVLIQRYWADLVTYALGFGGDVHGAEDEVQNAFIRLWQHRERWTPGGTVRGYLYTILRNSCLNAAAARRARMSGEGHLVLSGRRTPTPYEVVQEREVARVLVAAIDRLPPRRQEIFKLVCIHGLSYKDVGDVMGIAVPTVANQMSAALDQLRSAVSAVSDALSNSR